MEGVMDTILGAGIQLAPPSTSCSDVCSTNEAREAEGKLRSSMVKQTAPQSEVETRQRINHRHL